MSDFRQLRVGDHISLLSGFPFSSDYFDQQEGTRLIRIRDLLDSEGETYYRGVFDSKWLVRHRDILIGMDGDFNIARWKGSEALLNQRILKADARSNGLIEQDFFFYWFGPLLLQIHNRTAATTVKHLSIKDVENAKGLFPNKAAQRRIAEILSTLDEAIEQTEALIAKHQRIKSGLMHDLFTRGVTPDGHLRPTREQAPDLYKESPLGWIPKEWEISQLGEVAEVNRGKFTIRPRNDLRFYGGQYPFIQTGDVSLANGRVLSTFSQTLNQSGLAVSRLFDEGTIMVTIAANIADTCVLGLPMCAPDSLVGVLPNKGQVSRFLQLCISRRKSWLEARAPQTAQKNINLEDLRPLLIPSPCQHEQEAIAAIYECVDFSLAESEQMVGKLRQQKYGLMHDLLTGRMRVNV